MKTPETHPPIHPDPYRASHKAIRVAFGELLASAGRVDFGDLGAVERFQPELEDVVGILATHARIELQFVDPLLGAHDHASAASVQHEHTSLERKLLGVTERFHALAEDLSFGRAGDEARERGHAFYLQLTRFVAAYLEHMAAEEEEILPALRRHVGEAAIEAAIERGRLSIERTEAAKLSAAVISASTHSERVALLRGPGREELRTIARIVLGPSAWSAVEAELD